MDQLNNHIESLYTQNILMAVPAPGLCEVRIFQNSLGGWFRFLVCRLTTWKKIYVNHDAKKFILFNAREYLKQTAGTEYLPLKQRLDGSDVRTQLSRLLLPYDEESPEIWANRIIRTFRIRQGFNACSKKIVLLDFPPTKVDFYRRLQHRIAKIIPRESFRPTIDIRIRGNQAGSGKALGILGGMGPLSDSGIIEKAIEILPDKEIVSVDLFSIPPPRTFWEKLFRGLKYLRDVKTFASRHEIDKIYITSNTAHAHFPFWQRYCMGKAASLVDQVAQNLPHAQYLILCTKEAYDHRLYQTKLASQKIPFIEVSKEDSVILQRIIHNAKESKLSEGDYRACQHIIQSHTHILLGCTELSLVFNQFKSLADDRTVIHSKDIFSRIISGNFS